MAVCLCGPANGWVALMPATWEFQVLAAVIIVLGAWGLKSELAGRVRFQPGLRGFTLGAGWLDGCLFIYLGAHMLVCFLGAYDAISDAE
jgi:hypothetical protein